MMNRVLCFGGRDVADKEFIASVLSQLPSILTSQFCIIHGGAKGADSLCAEYARSEGWPVVQVDANWNYFRNAAGPIRNQWMLDYCSPTYAIAFPGGKGTADMTARVRAAKIDLWEVE